MAREDYVYRIENGQAVPLTEAEIDDCVAREIAHAASTSDRALNAIRKERDKRLAAADPMMLEDHPKNGNRAAWVSYRAALRDLPATVEPETFVSQWHDFIAEAPGVNDPWPAKPA